MQSISKNIIGIDIEFIHTHVKVIEYIKYTYNIQIMVMIIIVGT